MMHPSHVTPFVRSLMLFLFTMGIRWVDAASGKSDALVSQSGDFVPDRIVEDCVSLREALMDVETFKILAKGKIRCGMEDWPMPVIVRRSVEITGVEISRLKSFTDVTVIDWGNLGKAVVGEHGAIVYFHDMMVIEDQMGLSGVNVGFFFAKKASVGVFGAMVVGVRSCLGRLASFDASKLKRPDFLKGDQSVTPITENAVHMNDLAIWWPNLVSLWHFCRVVFCCDVDSIEDAQAIENVAELLQLGGHFLGNESRPCA